MALGSGSVLSAVIAPSGQIRKLDRPTEPREQVTEDDAADPGRVARMLMSLSEDTSDLKGRWGPGFLEFEDLVVDNTGTTKYRLAHNLGQRVRWWAVDWDGGAACALAKDSSSDNNTLVLISFEVGTVTVRLELAG